MPFACGAPAGGLWKIGMPPSGCRLGGIPAGADLAGGAASPEAGAETGGAAAGVAVVGCAGTVPPPDAAPGVGMPGCAALVLGACTSDMLRCPQFAATQSRKRNTAVFM